MDLEAVEDTAAVLLAAATDVSASTRVSYERRWRMWEAFADHHGVRALPAEPAHVAAFVVARHEAGVSPSGIAANLSAIGWFHARLGVADDLCGLARVVLRVVGRGGKPAVRPAPVLSVGALLAMARATPALGRGFAVKLVRSALGGVPPRQLLPVGAEDLRWGPGDAWVELALPAVPQRRRCPALPARVVRLVADAGWVACPVRALRHLHRVAGGGLLFSRGLLSEAHLGSFNPTSSPEGLPARLQVRNAAIVCVGYGGALRIEELARARIEHVEPIQGGYRLRIPVAKTSRLVADQATVLDQRDDDLDPIAALDRWLAVRSDHDGPLFTALHHRAPGRRAPGAHMPAGDIREVIGDLARLVGLPASVSGYSLRRSWATHRWLEDPNALARISLQLRHAKADVTVRYIDDLRLQTVDAQALLSPAVVVAGPGGQPGQRKDLGFAPLPLEVLVERAETLSHPAGTLSCRSRSCYDSLWSIWERFATGHGLAVLPATAEGVALFIASRADTGLRPDYLRQHLSVIERYHTEAGHPVAGLGGLAREVLDAYARTATSSARTAPLVALDDLRAMAHHAQETGGPDALRSWVMVCVGYSGAMRPGDLRHAWLEDVERRSWGLLLGLRRSVDTPGGEVSDSVVLLRREDELDPVAAIDGLVAATGRRSGPLLAGFRSGRGRPLSTERMTDCLRALAAEVGVRVVPTGDSLRRSWATHAYEAGVDLVTIQRHLRHERVTVTRDYLSSLSAWANNPAALLATIGDLEENEDR
ncbi:MAG: tyrosine-type recombinase/integrase [Acidimicrobiales bacterium]